jgi:hypothetical protein
MFYEFDGQNLSPELRFDISYNILVWLIVWVF